MSNNEKSEPAPKGDFYQEVFGRPRGTNIDNTFVVEDMNQTVRLVVDAGGTIMGDIYEGKEGWIAACYGPDGNPFIVVQHKMAYLKSRLGLDK